MTVIKNAVIITANNSFDEFFGYMKFDEGKIISVCEGEYDGDDEAVIDAHGAYLMPGLIDAHTHLGTVGDSVGFESDDINDINDPCSPQLSALDSINPLDRCFSEARAAGITTVCTGPGSANPLAGTFVAMKTAGKRIDKMVLKCPCSMKLSLGENPKMSYHDKDETPETRMSTAAIIREALNKALRYEKAKKEAGEDEDGDEPDYDAKCEALLPVLRGEIPLHIHAHRADDIFTGIRIAKEFGLKYSLIHCTEGALIAEELAEENPEIMLGPFLCDRSKPELKNLSPETCGILERAGLNISIITDHPVIPVQYLMLCAALAVKNGMTRAGALRAVTINPARLCGLDDRIGSLETGKDADFALYSGEPLNLFSRVLSVWINGRRVDGI